MLVDQLDPELRSSLLMLSVALSQLEERRGLELELEAEGVRVPVALVAGERVEQSWGWAAHVEAVIAAADDVVGRVLSPAAQTIPAHELASFDRLCDAVLAHRDHPTLAERWREMGGTLAIAELADRLRRFRSQLAGAGEAIVAADDCYLEVGLRPGRARYPWVLRMRRRTQ
jgi:hypothetical protein